MSILSSPFRAFGALMAKVETACTSDAETTKAVHLADQYAKLQTSLAKSLITVTETEERKNKWLDESDGRKAIHNKHEAYLNEFLASRNLTIPGPASSAEDKPKTRAKAKAA